MAVMVKRSVYDGGELGSTGAESHLVVLGMIPPLSDQISSCKRQLRYGSRSRCLTAVREIRFKSLGLAP